MTIKPTIVIVDDHSEIREMLSMLLALEGFEILGVAEDGRKGLELVESELQGNVDAVLLDLSMPVMDGLQVLSALREGDYSGVIVILTGFNAKTLDKKVQLLGADDYVEKGVDLMNIPDRLKALIKENQKEK